jgi:hypothetical protein
MMMACATGGEVMLVAVDVAPPVPPVTALPVPCWTEMRGPAWRGAETGACR